MTENRRYSDMEVQRIFEEAATLAGQRKRSPDAEGLTLAELQDIGREVGLPPDRIVAAAKAIDVTTPLPRRRHFGLPIGIGHVVSLARALDDREWEIFLGEIRRTFGSAGRDRSTGAIRHWSNGNLHVFIEPMEDGARLRIGTLKGNAVAANWLGFSWTLAGSTFLLASGAGLGELLLAPGTALTFLGMGVGALLTNVLRLPGWANTREEQMIDLAERARAIVARAPDGSKNQ